MTLSIGYFFVHCQTLLLSLEERDAEEIILVLRGYHKLLTDRVLPVHRERTRWTQDSGKFLIHQIFIFWIDPDPAISSGSLSQIFQNAAPPYHTRHTVQPALWSFLEQPPHSLIASSGVAERAAFFADLSVPPPYHPPPPGFQVHLKRDELKKDNCSHLNLFCFVFVFITTSCPSSRTTCPPDTSAERKEAENGSLRIRRSRPCPTTARDPYGVLRAATAFPWLSALSESFPALLLLCRPASWTAT